MITDKNKYKPGDLIRFKSYALSNIKSPLRKELEIWLSGYPKTIKVGYIEPHRPGSYAGELKLHDSLKLQLDRNYNLQLREKGGRIVADCDFKFEDYELFGNKLDIQLANSRQFYPENNQLTITSTDANGLLLKDAKASILVKTSNIIETYQPFAILPDTLIFKQIDLDPAKPTLFDIPFDLFQKTNTNYQVVVTVLNSQNQRLESRDMATFFYSEYELISHFSNDSICFKALKNGEPVENLPIELRYNNDLEGQTINLPYKVKLNPATIIYNLKNDLLYKQVTLSHLNPELEIKGGITKDSFNVQLYNPQKLDISWYIYKGSTLLKKGFGQDMDYKSLIDDRTQTYYIELLYSFGGQEHLKRSQYVFKEDFLDVSIDIPERVYPGQQVDATIHVNDQLGGPVKGVDLTAWAVTSKLNYSLPDLPYYGSSSVPRPKRAYYDKRDLNKRSASFDLNYRRWEKLARLDTMMYYRFTYPWLRYFKYMVDASDSTQFAPYVMQNGRALEVHVIELDRLPVYYSWTNQPKQYSFYISPGNKHEISLRLHDRVLVLDSMAFEKGKKTIISIDLDLLPKGVKEYKLSTSLTSTERGRCINYVSAFQYINTSYAYLESDKEFIPLFNSQNPLYSKRYSLIVGPVTPGRTTYFEGEFLKTTYNHTGGYSYAFEENIVYKMHSDNLLPDFLSKSYLDPMQDINGKVVTKKHFLKSHVKMPISSNWHPSVVDLVAPEARIKIFLPYEVKASGIAAYIFEDCVTKNTVSPYYDSYMQNRADLYSIPMDCNNFIVLYNNGTYLKMDSINLKKYSKIAIDMKNTELHPSDSISQYWLIWSPWKTPTIYEPQQHERAEVIYSRQMQYSTGNVSGTIYDQNNEPLIGVTLIIKGTNIGTVTNIDGRFSIQIDDYSATLNILYVGFVSEEIEVTRGSEVEVHLIEDIQSLSEVVVIGYGSVSKSDMTGAVSSISSSYIEPKEEAEMEESREEEQDSRESEKRLYQELLTLNSIRSNFSDIGFWEPRLYTDRKGESQFKVTFPDDITKWDAVVYAMNKRLQTGTARKFIKSYKPLMADLHVPQFLTRGDTSMFIGKVLNYTSDSSIEGMVKWSGTHTDFEKNVQFAQYHTDKLPVFAVGTDSITASYTFKRNDGYFDGEERTVPIVEQGIIRSNGTLVVLNNGDESHVTATDGEKTIVEIMDNQLDIYNQDVNYLLHYRYDCNEQLASKLIGLINYKLIKQYEVKPFLYERNINKIIERLLKNQNGEFLWSWWDVSSNTSYWMSAHILRALKCAKDAGYNVDLNIENITRKAEYKFEFIENYSLYDIDLLHSLARWGANLNYPKYLHMMDSIIITKEAEENAMHNYNHYYGCYSYLQEKFLLQEIRQITGLSYQRDSIMKYKKEGIMGEIFFSDEKPGRYWYSDNLVSNKTAYRIIRNDSVLNDLRVPMQLYFMASHKNEGWNTYQSSNIIMEVLPDLLAEGFSKEHATTIIVSGKENKTIAEFPYHIELLSNEKLDIKKESGLPVFCQQYKQERVTMAKTGVAGFKIKTYFSDSSTQLKAGEPVNLITEVEVKKTSFIEHVMIEIPIPGACSYADKRQSYGEVETHREYFKDRTLIFCENLKAGKYLFVVRLLPRFTGKYMVNPAQVSLMYVPVVNANTNMKQVEVIDRE